MWLSDDTGYATHRDLREDKSKSRRYQLSSAKIGSVSINPVDPSFVLTASNSRVLRQVVVLFAYSVTDDTTFR